MGMTVPFALLLLGLLHVQVIALANLLPQQTDEDNAAVDELDSYMYQTVGHQAVAAYAECMQLPLYRRRIRGSSKCLDLVYRPTEVCVDVNSSQLALSCLCFTFSSVMPKPS